MKNEHDEHFFVVENILKQCSGLQGHKIITALLTSLAIVLGKYIKKEELDRVMKKMGVVLKSMINEYIENNRKS